MKRRVFLSQSGKVSLGFMGLQALMSACDSSGSGPKWTGLINDDIQAVGFGPLVDDPLSILNLPKGFSYKIISRQGDEMSDGFLVPGLADGMASFEGPDNKIIIVRNHEVSPQDKSNGAFGSNLERINNISKESFYDFGRGELPCLGGTSTIVYDPLQQKIETEYLSLAGTIRNCAGGSTPWNSWITCEENTSKASDVLEKDHGYNFEVPASTEIQIFQPTPLVAMGRFNHEAVCVDPRTSIVYQTEDRPDSLIYRFIPNEKENLRSGGKLQILAIVGTSGFDTRNWSSTKNEIEVGKKYDVQWLDIDDVKSPEDNLRHRGAEKGAAIFARGEGMWFGQNELYFACTNGGIKGHGQIFKYTPSPAEGNSEEQSSPGTLELFIEPNNSNLVESCDNVTIAPNGHLVLCEDKSTPRIVGVTPQGKIYHIAKNVGYKSEFAGACFSPDGKILFVNIQGPGLTIAIEGWV